VTSAGLGLVGAAIAKSGNFWLSVAYNTALMGSSAYGAAESFSNGQAGLGAVAVVGLALSAIGLGDAILDYAGAEAKPVAPPKGVAETGNAFDGSSTDTCQRRGGGPPPPRRVLEPPPNPAPRPPPDGPFAAPGQNPSDLLDWYKEFYSDLDSIESQLNRRWLEQHLAAGIPEGQTVQVTHVFDDSRMANYMGTMVPSGTGADYFPGGVFTRNVQIQGARPAIMSSPSNIYDSRKVYLYGPKSGFREFLVK